MTQTAPNQDRNFLSSVAGLPELGEYSGREITSFEEGLTADLKSSIDGPLKSRI
jgi:hypothetical protein